jgi:hemerythrin-like domain-containing protein
VALAVLDRLEAAVRDLTTPGALAVVQEAIAFLDEELRAHNEREEKTLFPVLERYLPPQGPTDVMRSEHRELWKLLDDLDAGMRDTPPSPSNIYQRGMAAADLLRRHIQKENGILFPMAEQLLSPEEMSSIARQMESLMAARAHARESIGNPSIATGSA